MCWSPLPGGRLQPVVASDGLVTVGTGVDYILTAINAERNQTARPASERESPCLNLQVRYNYQLLSSKQIQVLALAIATSVLGKI